MEDYGNVKKKKEVQNIKFIVARGTYDPTMSKSMLQHPEEHQISRSKKKSHLWVCHYCKRKGHIRPLCFKLYGYLNQFLHETTEPEVRNGKKERRPKCDHVGLMAHTSLKALFREDWYFDNGCSRHMTRDNKFLDTVKSYTNSHVTFGNGTEGKIHGIESLINDELPKHDNVL